MEIQLLPFLSDKYIYLYKKDAEQDLILSLRI